MIETDEDLILFRYNGVEYEPVTIKKPNPPPKPPKPPRAPKAPKAPTSCSMVTVRRTSTRFNGLEVTTSKHVVSLAEAKKRTRFSMQMCGAMMAILVVAVSFGLWGTTLLSSGFVMMFMWFASRGFKAQVAAMVSNSERVMAWLQGPGHGLSSFSEIMKGTKLTERELAETLTAMKASGEVTEDFDENAEKWLYSIESEDDVDDLVPLSDRV